MSPEEEKVQRLEQRIAQLEQALQEKNAPASSQPSVPPPMPQQEAPPTIPPPVAEIPPMQTTQPTPPPLSFQQNVTVNKTVRISREIALQSKVDSWQAIPIRRSAN